MLELFGRCAAGSAGRLPDQAASLRIHDINGIAFGIVGANSAAAILVHVITAGKHDDRSRTTASVHQSNAGI